MDADYWKKKWSENNIGFHQGSVNRHLRQHIDCLALSPGKRIFLPLCGKTRDIGWLHQGGLHVVGIELEQVAVEQLFKELNVMPDVHDLGRLLRYSTDRLDIFVGDIFSLSAELCGEIDAVYDRAALVALPPKMRERYARHLASITHHARQLLITFVYDQSKMNGPPFSVGRSELQQRYAEYFIIDQLQSLPLDAGFEDLNEVEEISWFLHPKAVGVAM